MLPPTAATEREVQTCGRKFRKNKKYKRTGNWKKNVKTNAVEKINREGKTSTGI